MTADACQSPQHAVPRVRTWHTPRRRASEDARHGTARPRNEHRQHRARQPGPREALATRPPHPHTGTPGRRRHGHHTPRPAPAAPPHEGRPPGEAPGPVTAPDARGRSLCRRRPRDEAARSPVRRENMPGSARARATLPHAGHGNVRRARGRGRPPARAQTQSGDGGSGCPRPSPPNAP